MIVYLVMSHSKEDPRDVFVECVFSSRKLAKKFKKLCKRETSDFRFYIVAEVVQEKLL